MAITSKKVYISADIEGVNGVVYPHQIEKSGGDSYLLAKKQQYEELNCIIDALLSQDVEKITVNDAHGVMDNIPLTEIDPKVELITGKPKPVSMLFGLDSTYSCVFLIGYHAMAGSIKGILAHTFSEIFKSVKLNGKQIGEIELNSIFAGLNNIPVALVSGDDICCQEAKELLGNIITVVTKKAVSTTCAVCKPNEKLFKELNSAAVKAINSPELWSLYKVNAPYEFEIEFKDRKNADLVELLPFVERKSATNISLKSTDYQELYRYLQFFAATLR